jgi:geranylgeranyl diphosphate synthase type I
MKQKNAQFSSKKTTMAKIQKVLRERSSTALGLARKRILEIEVENSRGQQALKLYAKHWDDITHPGMLALACEAVGGSPDQSVPVQVATLLLTAAMDLHDDAIDKSEVKNGKMTVYGKFGSDISILIGDAFFLEGFLLLQRHAETTTQATIRKILGTIEKAFVRIGNAHLLDATLKGEKNISPAKYLRIVEKKASGIEVHFRIGAIVGGGTEDQIEALGQYGRILGTLIILREDYIDLFEPKELSNRIKNELPPFPILCAFQDINLKKKILGVLSDQKISEKEVNNVLYAIREAGVINDFRLQMQDIARNAYRAIESIQEKEKVKLNLLIEGTLEDI